MNIEYALDQQYLIFRVADKLIATNIALVKRILHYEFVQKVPLARDYFEGLVKFDEKPIPFFNLPLAMGIKGKKVSTENLIAVHNVQGIDIAFKIGNVVTVTRIDRSALGESTEGIKGVDHKTSWSGEEVYILNAEKIVQ
ncbi:MAG: chemotaxis protein CheW [Deltaproteobacteria bacterium]|nr:chemotaxis protein CheW [Deltaproteobacteria bacterium]